MSGTGTVIAQTAYALQAQWDQHIPPDMAGATLQVIHCDAGVAPVDVGTTAAAATMTGTLPAVAGATNAITGFEVTGLGATGASGITVTVTGVVGGPLEYALAIPAGATVGVTPLIVQFPVPIAATGPNVAIVVTVPSFGAGNTSAALTVHGIVTTSKGLTVTWQLDGGARQVTIDKPGDKVTIPLHGVAQVTIEAASYPTTIAYGIVPAGVEILTGLTRSA